MHIATPGADRRFMQFGKFYSPAHDAEFYGSFFPPRLARIMLLRCLSTTVSAGQEAPGFLPWDTAADPYGTRCGCCSVQIMAGACVIEVVIQRWPAPWSFKWQTEREAPEMSDRDDNIDQATVRWQ